MPPFLYSIFSPYLITCIFALHTFAAVEGRCVLSDPLHSLGGWLLLNNNVMCDETGSECKTIALYHPSGRRTGGKEDRQVAAVHFYALYALYYMWRLHHCLGWDSRTDISHFKNMCLRERAWACTAFCALSSPLPSILAPISLAALH